MAVIKADGYGHGLLPVARALADADAFGVASLEEALALRRGGVERPVVLLEGFFSTDELAPLIHHGVQAVIHEAGQLATLEAARLAAPLSVWLKVDTGMHRIGFPAEQAPGLWQRLLACRDVRPVGVISHLAGADVPGDAATAAQIACFQSLALPDDTPRSLANSAGALAWPDSHHDWVRPGIMLYGSSPLVNRSATELGLKPAMKLRSQLISVQRLAKNARVGYGGDYVCAQAMPVGVVACGYGDGYPRHAPSGTPVEVGGVRVPLIGRVSMDMISVDLSAVPEACVGTAVILWGGQVPVDEVARYAGTIAYELMCGVTARVPRDVR